MLVIPGFFSLPEVEIELTYVRSSGPGGQNVNKVSSKCQLRWNALVSPSIPAHLRERILSRLSPRLTREGDLILTSDVYRDQIRNRGTCFEKLREILMEAARPPQHRKATKPTRGSQRRRVGSKRKHSEKKGMRGKVRSE